MSFDSFMSEAAWNEMQEERAPHAHGWADQFNTYEDACRFYGLPTPAQERADAEYEEEQWWNSLTHEEQRQHIVRFLYECEYAVPSFCDRYQPEKPIPVCLDPTDPFSSTVMMQPITVQLHSGQIVHKQLWMNDLTPDGREIGYINVWKDRVPVVRIGLTNRWVIDVEAIRAMQQAQ